MEIKMEERKLIKPILIQVTSQDIKYAMQQIEAFKQTEAGQWRYDDVKAWRGIVCELLTSRWLSQNYKVDEGAKGLDTSGITDEYDLKMYGKSVEIKSATEYHYQYIMPKVHDMEKPKDVYVGAKYDDRSKIEWVEVLGWIYADDVKRYPIEQDKGSPYYKVPIADLNLFKEQEDES